MINVITKIGLTFSGFLLGVIVSGYIGAKYYPEVDEWMKSKKEEKESVDAAE